MRKLWETSPLTIGLLTALSILTILSILFPCSAYAQENRISPDKMLEKVVPPGVKATEINISKIYYRAPGSDSTLEITSQTLLQPGGTIWLEITLPELGGYLVGLLQDRDGEIFNIFPGTLKALTEGHYRVPLNLDTPYTSIQKVAAENSVAANLPANKLLLGGYTFDDKSEKANFSFYYTEKRNQQIESILQNSKFIGQDMPKMKGLLPSSFDLDKKITHAVFYHINVEMKIKKLKKLK